MSRGGGKGRRGKGLCFRRGEESLLRRDVSPSHGGKSQEGRWNKERNIKESRRRKKTSPGR